MGAWGIGPFENDDAQDFLSDFCSSGPLAIDETFENVLDDSASKCIESFNGAAAVAAIEVLALYVEKKLLRNKFIKDNEIEPKMLAKLGTKKRLSMARKVGKLILSEKSELRQLWEDEKKGKIWANKLSRSLERLTE